MRTPGIDPNHRDPATVAPASTYHRGDPVWVYRYDTWRPGVVESASAYAVMATFRHTTDRGTAVDTMTARYVVRREDVDPIDSKTRP